MTLQSNKSFFEIETPSDSDLEKFITNLRKVIKEVEKAGDVLSDRIAVKFKNELKKTILDQQYTNWAPLKESYIAYKQRKGLDPRTLIAKKSYVESIEVKKDGIGVRVVAPKDGKHYSGLSYQQLGMVHEFGSVSRGIPARPAWNPLIRKYKINVDSAQTELNELMKEKLKELM